MTDRRRRLLLVGVLLLAACGEAPPDAELRRTALQRVGPVLERGTPMARVVGHLRQQSLSYRAVSEEDCQRAGRSDRPCWGGGYLDVEVPSRPLAGFLGGRVVHVVIQFGQSREVESHRVEFAD